MCNKYALCCVPTQIFHDILYEVSKSQGFMRQLRQVLSQGHRELQEKRKYYGFRWAQLQNQNCSRQEYQK